MSVDLDNPGEHHEWARVLEAATKERDALRSVVGALRNERDDIRAQLTSSRQHVGQLIRDLNDALYERDCARDERDAYRKAKQENDERFMIERDEARAELERVQINYCESLDLAARYRDQLTHEERANIKLRSERSHLESERERLEHALAVTALERVGLSPRESEAVRKYINASIFITERDGVRTEAGIVLDLLQRLLGDAEAKGTP